MWCEVIEYGLVGGFIALWVAGVISWGIEGISTAGKPLPVPPIKFKVQKRTKLLL